MRFRTASTSKPVAAYRRVRLRAWTATGVAIALGLAGIGPAARADDLHVPESLRDHIEFWKRVFAEWELSQIVVHDSRHPRLVYDVLDLPGPAGDSYSAAQSRFVRETRKRYHHRIRDLETKLKEGAALTDDEKALALRIATTAGTDAVAGAADRVRSQRGLRERFRTGLETSGRYDAIFREIFRDEGLPEDLAYLPHVESSYQAYLRSSADAIGMWQFTRSAGRLFLAISDAIDERLDPVASARGAARYLKRAHEILGTWPLAITSYNHGIGGMSRAKERFGTDFERIVREYDGRSFGFASRNFYLEFLAAREIARDPHAYFPEGLVFEPPLSEERVVLDRPTRVDRLVERHGVPIDELAERNPAWTRRALRGSSPLPAGTWVWLPEGTLGSPPRAPETRSR